MKIPNYSLEGGMYSVPCFKCKSVYIGKTLDIERRIYQHHYNLRTGDGNSAIYIHRKFNNHNNNIIEFLKPVLNYEVIKVGEFFNK